jgi:opacity protein-like surface antigen
MKVRVVTLAIACLLGLSRSAQAQNAGGIEVAAGYSFLHDQELEENLPLGWVVSVAGPANAPLSIVGEVGGNYKTLSALGVDVTLRVHSFLAGVKVASRTGPGVTPFGQILAGAARFSGDVNVAGFGVGTSETGFALQPGGGVDVGVGARAAVRLEGDYRLVRVEGSNGNEWRFVVGVVFRP